MDEKLKEVVSRNISKFREAMGISQKQLAEKLGVKPSRVSNWEQGSNLPAMDIFFDLCDALNVSINDLCEVYPKSKTSLTYDEMKMIEDFRQLDLRGKENIRDAIDSQLKFVDTNPKKGQAS